jgi:hypothetical protein
VPGAGVLGAGVAEADDQDAVAVARPGLAATVAAAKDRQGD